MNAEPRKNVFVTQLHDRLVFVDSHNLLFVNFHYMTDIEYATNFSTDLTHIYA